MRPAIISLFAAVLFMNCYGCSKPSGSEPTPAAGDLRGDHSIHGGADAGHGDESAMSDMEKMHAALSKLSPGDTASAELQHVCPVSGEMLGVMGPPIKVEVKGRDIWICCVACRDKLMESPGEYLSKLDHP